MWARDIDTADYAERLAGIEARLRSDAVTRRPARLVLGIETSCDETAAAVVGGRRRGAVVGGLEPGRPARRLRRGGPRDRRPGPSRAADPGRRPRRSAGAGLSAGPRACDAVAATIGPGLIGSLLVGVSEAKALALAWDVPFVGRQPPRGPPLRRPPRPSRIEWPVAVLPRLGGPHPARLHGGPRPLPAARARPSTTPPGRPSTRWPGSSASATPAARPSSGPPTAGDPTAFAFPRAMLDDGLDFSFCGLKTAVRPRRAAPPRRLRRGRGGLVPAGRGGRAGGQGRAGAAAAVGARGCAWPAGWPPTGPCGRALADGRAPSSASPPTCPAGPCAPTTRP